MAQFAPMAISDLTTLQQQQQQRSALQAQNDAAQAQAAALEADRKQAEKNRRYQLTKELAAQRARQAASGAGGAGGSGAALLSGISKDAEDEIGQTNGLVDRRLDSIRSRMSTNLVEYKQAQQRQFLDMGGGVLSQLSSKFQP